MNHTPPSGNPDTSKILLDEQTALVGGIIVTVLFGAPAAFIAISTFVSLIDDLVVLAIATWLTWMMIQFWTSETYKGGLTLKKIIKAAIWPYDLTTTIWAGTRKQEGKPVAPESDTSKKVLDETQALWAGVVLSVITLILLILGISSAVAVVGGVVVICLAGYVVGLFIQYWLSKAYTEGLTVNEVLLTLAWPAATFRSYQAGRRAKRQARSQP